MKKEKYTQTILPNGMKIFCLQKNEVQLVYEEVQAYFKNGIELHEDGIVFDVGANIGLFTLWTYQMCNQNVSIYAFEPIPAIFEVLYANIQGLNTKNIKVFPYGLSEEPKTVRFAYYPNATITSRLYPGVSKEEQDQLKNMILSQIKEMPPIISWLRWLRWLPPFLRSFIIEKKIEKAFQIELVSCQLRTVSEIIREHNVQRIDLLKVDVEKSELDVLLGIEKQDWHKIKQVVVEIHDTEHRVKKITALLKEHGLSSITVEPQAILKGSDTFTLYALRQKD